MIELEGTREKLDKEKMAFKMVSSNNKPCCFTYKWEIYDIYQICVSLYLFVQVTDEKDMNCKEFERLLEKYDR